MFRVRYDHVIPLRFRSSDVGFAIGVELPTLVHSRDRPREMCYWDDEEAATSYQHMCPTHSSCTGRTYLFESSSIPASALYHAKKAANSAKKPPAFSMGAFTLPVALGCRYAIARSKKAISSVKNRVKKATVERRVASKRRNVKMNQPC